MKLFKYILFPVSLLAMVIFSGCKKEYDEISTVSLGLPIIFERFAPGDSLLAGQVLSIRGQGMRRLTEVSANGNALAYEEMPNGIDVKIDPFYFPDGSYTFKLKRFDGEQLISSPPVHVFGYQLSVNSGRAGDEMTITAAGALNKVQKVLFTAAGGTTEAMVISKNAQEIKFKVPQKAVNGNLYLQLINPSDPEKPVMLATGRFNVVIDAPNITSVTPASASYGSVITITGRNFGDVGANGELFYNRRVLFTAQDGTQLEGTLVNGNGAQTATKISVVVPYFIQSTISVEIEGLASNLAAISANSTVTDKRLLYIINGVQLNALTLKAGAPLASANVLPNVSTFATNKSNNRVYYTSDGMSLNYVDMATGQSTTAFSDANGFSLIEIQGNRIFWKDLYNTIHCAGVDGSNLQTLKVYDSNVVAITGTPDGRLLYVLYEFYDSQTGEYSLNIDRINAISGLVSTVVTRIGGAFTLQFVNDQLYYAASESEPAGGTVFSILSVNANGGSAPKKIHTLEPLHLLNNMVVDAQANRIYWIDAAGARDNILQSINIDGGNPQNSGTLKDGINSKIFVW